MGIRKRIRFGRVLLALGVLVTAVLVVRAVLNSSTGRRLEAAFSAAKASGLPIAAKDIAPADCADVDNAANLWMAAEALLVPPEGPTKKASVMAMDSLFDGPPLDPESRKLVATWIAKNSRALGLVLDASSLPCFVYARSDVPLWERLWERPIPDGVKLLFTARLLAARALLGSDGPTWEEGLDGCVRGIRFFKTLARGDGAVLIMGLIAIADLKMLIAGLDRVVQGRAMGTPELLELMKEFDTQSWRREFARVIRAEGVLGLELGLARLSGDPQVPDTSPFFQSRRLERLRAWLIRPALKTKLRKGLEWLGEVDKVLPLPYHEQRDAYERLVARLRPDTEDKDPLDGLLIWDHRAAFMKEATLEAMMQATRAGLACKAFRNTNGRYPDRLEEMVPAILPEVPLDPFTGKPLVYRPSPDGVLIYSVGSNGKDDGGRQTYEITQLVMDKDDDWRWSEEAPRDLP